MNTETPRYRSFRRGSGTKAAPFGRRFVAGAMFPRWLTAILAIAALLWATTALAHENDGYSHDSSTSQLRMSWMAGLSGDSRISELSLPGTHDTMSFYGGDAVQTQSFSLPHQLDAGIRVLDIRARHIDNVFAIHHGVVYQHAMFGGDVMKPIAQFLRAHPTETVLIRLKEEYDPSNNSRSFADTFLAYMNSYDAEIQGVYGDYVWRPNGAVNPTLAQVRGKVVFMLPPSGFDSTTLAAWGIPYDDSAVMSIQDDYNLSTNWDLYSKWERVRDHLYAADRGSRNLIYMNYLSGSGGSFPYFVASGHSSPGTGAPRLATGLTTPGWDSSYPDFPRVDCWWNIFVWGDTCTIAFEGTNILTKNLLRTGRLGRVGIVMADFPGAGLIDAVIARNRVVTFVGKSGFNGKCLDLDVASSNLQVWDCHGGINQQWIYEKSTGVIRSLASDKCLDASGYYGNAYLYPCHYGLNQRWDLLPTGQIRDRAHGQCLDLFAFNTANGANVTMWPCNDASNQRWDSVSELNTLSSGFNGRCLDVDGASSNVQVWDCSGGMNQRWVYHWATGTMNSLASDKCLDASAYYGNAYMHACHGGLNQQWDLLPSGQIRERAYSQCLDLYAFANTNGANVVMWQCNDASNQRWNKSG